MVVVVVVVMVAVVMVAVVMVVVVRIVLFHVEKDTSKYKPRFITPWIKTRGGVMG